MKELIKDFFSFTRGERNGIFVLVIIIIFLLFLPKIINYFQERNEFDYAEFEAEIKDFQKSLELRKKRSYKNKFGKGKKSNKNFLTMKGNSNLDNRDEFISNKKYSVSKKYSVKKWQLRTLEINSADSTELLSIYGIGPVLSKRIIKYRDLLGGFYNKTQLLEVYGLDSIKLEKIGPSILIDTVGIKKIDINCVTLSQLRYHPYLTNYESKAIINYQKYKGKIISLDELISNNLVSEENFNKIKFYLKMN